MKKIFTEAELQALCAKYQKLLRLQDWQVEVRLVHQSEIQDDETDPVDGRHNSTLHFQRSLIRIPTAASWKSSLLHTEQDMRLTLIHELVHLLFATLGPSSESNSEVTCSLWELGIEKMAEAIHQLTHGYVEAGVADEDA